MFICCSFTQYSKQNKDEKREKELIEALLVRKETPTVKEVDTAAFYKKVAVMEPASKCVGGGITVALV